MRFSGGKHAAARTPCHAPPQHEKRARRFLHDFVFVTFEPRSNPEAGAGLFLGSPTDDPRVAAERKCDAV